MKVVALVIAALNLFLGSRCVLNLVGVLRTSKYATSTTALFAVLFLGFGLATVWFAFWLSIGPWVLAILVMFIQLVVGNPR